MKIKRVWKKLPRYRYIFVLTFAVLGGIILLLTSHAQSPFAGSEAETGALVGANIVTDSSASGGQAIQFGTKIYTVPSNITADCSVSVESQINAWLATVPDGATAQLTKGACYGQTNSIVMSGRTNFTLDGNGAMFKALTPQGDGTQGAPSSRSNILIIQGSNVTVENITTWGANDLRFGPYNDTYTGPGCPSGCDEEFQHGVSFSGTQGGKVINSTIEYPFGDFVESNPGPIPVSKTYYDASDASSNIVVSGVTMERSGRQGISITDTNGVTIQNSSLNDVGIDAIDIEPDYPQEIVKNVSIDHNNFGAVHSSIMSLGGWETPGNILNIGFTNNTMTAGPQTCWDPITSNYPSYDQIQGITVTGNTLSSLDELGIFGPATNVTVSNNTNTLDGVGCGGGGVAGVVFNAVQTGTVSNNTFINANRVADLNGSTGITVCQNRLSTTGAFTPTCP